MERANIPVIDLEKFEESEEWYKRLREICEEWGCFRIVNHKISTNLMAQMKEIGGSLFDRPIEIKERNVDDDVVSQTGYVGSTLQSPFYEALGFFDLPSLNSLHRFCYQLDISSQQREVIGKYVEEVHELYMEMARKLAKCIGVENGDLFEKWTSQLRFIKYHFSAETLGCNGTIKHTDSGFLTILQDDEIVEGLQVMNKYSAQYEAVDPWPSTFLLILGDVAKAWSNGRFRTLPHMVKCNKARTRISIGSFFLGPEKEEVEAPVELIDSRNPRLYASFKYEDYRCLRLSEKMMNGEALERLIIASNLP